MLRPLLALSLSLVALLPTAFGQTGQAEPDPIVARGKGLELRASELESALLLRYALAPEGRELLELMVSTKLIESIAKERGITASEKQIDRRWDELDQGFKAAGKSGGLNAEIARQDLSVAEFRDYLRISLLHEELTRRDLGIAKDTQVSGDQQAIWLQQQFEERGLEILPPPWDGKPVARCGSVSVHKGEFGVFLRARLARDGVVETAWHLLLARGLAKRLPQLSEEAFQRGIDAEIERRRSKHKRQRPELTYERLLGAQGRTLAGLRLDPAVHIATLSRLYVDGRYGTGGLRQTFDEERELFNGRHGEALHASMIFLVASRYKNELNPRTFESAEAELARYAARLGSTDDFAALAATVSEQANTRERRGELGWVTRRSPNLPRALCDALFRDWGTNKSIPAGGRALKTVRLETGVVLLWLDAHRDSPSWEVMSGYVHEELRRRLLLDILPRDSTEFLR